ncbi:MAG: peptidase [Pseudonocardiaceae bacterium]|nr:peptidase [Pseudonocardiaceae bacterium]
MFRTTVPLGRFAGIPVGAHWSVLVVIGLISYLLASVVLPVNASGIPATWYWLTGVLIAMCFVASLLAHELAHAATARRYGVGVKRITLWMLGGTAELEAEPPSPKADLVIASTGPAISLAIGGACWGGAIVAANWLPPLVAIGLLWLGVTNVVLAAFNMLPGAPLDGGRVLRAAVWKRTGDRRRARTVAVRAGQLLGIALALTGVAEALLLGRLAGLWLVLIGWFLLAAAGAERAGGIVRDQLGDIRIGAVMSPAPVSAPGWLTVQAFLDRIAVPARRRVFPVLSFGGSPVGTVSLMDLAKLSPQERMNTRISAVCRPAKAVAHSDDLLIDVLPSALPRNGQDLLLITDGGILVGVISAEDLTRTVELAALGHRPNAARESFSGL